MRLALKNTLFLFATYGLLLVVMAAVAVFQLLAMEANVQKETARLFAREVAGALTEPSLDQLLRADREARQNLRTLIEQLTRHSQVVSSISVVDRNGRVVASDDRSVGTRLATPDAFFGASGRMRFITFGSFPFPSGSYELGVPLVQRGERVGYLQIRLQSQSVLEMNRKMWNGLLFAATLGVACITGLGFLLHVQLTNRGKTLARTIEAALRGETPRIGPELDEFTQAIETAGRAAREFHRARGRGADEQGRRGILGQLLNTGVLLLDSEGRPTFASRRALDLFGDAGLEDLARTLTALRPDLDRAACDRPSAEREEIRVDVEVPGGEGGRNLRLELIPVGATGAAQPGDDGRLVLVRDRASIKALETDMRLASQLRGLARLYLSVVHDIRAPLGAVVANLELLGGTFEADAGSSSELDQRRRKYLAVVDQELLRLRRSVDALINHTALPRDNLEEIDVRDLIRDIEHLLSPQCERQNVAFSVRVPGAPLRVLCARDALKQALLNIGINALEAMPKGGRLDVDVEGRDSKVVVSIADSGPGIPPDLMEKIFTMHFTTKPGGTGIGLYVASAVVDSNGGEIRVTPGDAGGTRFQIDLPALSHGA